MQVRDRVAPDHALDFTQIGIYLGSTVAVFLVMLAMGLLLMPGGAQG